MPLTFFFKVKTIQIFIVLMVSCTAKASLIDRGGGMLYDDVLDITWLQDANYAKTSGYDNDGKMKWTEAKLWSEQLVYGGFDDWRLPNVIPIDGYEFSYTFGYDGTSDEGYNITSIHSEMSYMHYVNLGGVGLYDVNGGYQSNLISGSNFAWDGTADAITDDVTVFNLSPMYWFEQDNYEGLPSYAWAFRFDFGRQLVSNKAHVFSAWAVRDGDVSPVPVPASLWLLCTGLLGFLVYPVRKNHSIT